MDYSEIGKYVIEKASEYERALIEHDRLVKERHDIDEKIKNAEIEHDKDKLFELYKQFRIIKHEQTSNRCYRERFSEQFIIEILRMSKEKTNNER